MQIFGLKFGYSIRIIILRNIQADWPNLLLVDLWLRRRILRTAEIRLYGEERVGGVLYCVK